MTRKKGRQERRKEGRKEDPDMLGNMRSTRTDVFCYLIVAILALPTFGRAGEYHFVLYHCHTRVVPTARTSPRESERERERVREREKERVRVEKSV